MLFNSIQIHPHLSELLAPSNFNAGFCQRLLTDLGSSSSSSSSSPDLVLAIFEPYFSHVASFGDYVQRHLLKELESIPLSHADDIDAARLLADSIARVVALAKQGIEKCVCGICLNLVARHRIVVFEWSIYLPPM